MKPKHGNSWKGGRIDRDGYIYLFRPSHPHAGKQGYVAEHRLKMEKKLGRFLTRREVVHHKNHDRRDNRISNLKLFSSAGQHSFQEHPEALRKATTAALKKVRETGPNSGAFKKGDKRLKGSNNPRWNPELHH